MKNEESPMTRKQIALGGLLAAIAAIAACIPTFNAGCVRDPLTGQVRCSGEYIPPAQPAPVIGERG